MKFRKKPIVIEAIQYTGFNTSDVFNFVGKELEGDPNFDPKVKKGKGAIIYDFFIKTLEGKMKVSPNDWIIKGVNGEFYPCKPDIFEKTYDKVNDKVNE